MKINTILKITVIIFSLALSHIVFNVKTYAGLECTIGACNAKNCELCVKFNSGYACGSQAQWNQNCTNTQLAPYGEVWRTYKTDGGSGNGCYKRTVCDSRCGCGGNPTDPPGDALSCGEKGCNQQGCKSGQNLRCDGNWCNLTYCPPGTTKSGLCDCIPDTLPPRQCGESGCNASGCADSQNSCNSDVCQVNCPAGYSRSGNCGCTPIPLVCGAYGCNTFGCTSGNSCNTGTNVCQVNCPAGHTRSGDCNCLPPCSSLSYTYSQSSCALDVRASGAGPYFNYPSVVVTGFQAVKVSDLLYRHTITSGGTKSWTFSWRENASVGSGSRNCSSVASINIPLPVCGTVGVPPMTNPNPILWGSDVNLKVQFSPLESTAPHTYSITSNTHSVLTNCTGDAFLPGGENCFVPWTNSDPKTYSWNIAWRTTDKVCSALMNNTCSWSNQLQATNKPSYMKTMNGFSYIKSKDFQPAFNTEFPDHFSTNIFASNMPLTMDHTPNCTGNAVHCTESNYLLLNYQDSNSATGPLTWYAYFKNQLRKNLKVNLINWTGAGDMSAVNNLSTTKINVVEYTGTFTASGLGRCNNRTIFLIDGNLNITPEFTINDPTVNACLFIVNGTTRIFSSTKTPATCSGTHIDTTLVANPKDTIEAFIITNNFTTNSSAVQLYIKGGVITNTMTEGLNRKVNTNSCYFPNIPSEVIDYEGARYIKVFKDILGDSELTSVREIQYTGRN